MSLLNPYTSRLYEPLENTLRKSSVWNQNNNEASRKNFYSGAHSRVSARMRSLSPIEAQQIRRQTILPRDKNLIPTDHLWRVRGKQFTAVDISVKQGSPIPPEMMKNRNGPIIQETVYEFGLGSPIYPNKAQTIVLNQQQSNVESMRRVQSPPPVKIIQNPSFLASQSQHQFRLKEPQPLQMLSRNQSSRVKRSSNRQPIQLLNSGNNDKKRGKNQYKYNLFSAFDELVDTKCGSCGSNQIIASRPKNKQWK